MLLVIASKRSFPFILLSSSDGPIISPPSSQQFLLLAFVPKTRNLPRHPRFVRKRPATAQLELRSSCYQISPRFCSLHCRRQSSLVNCNFHLVKSNFHGRNLPTMRSDYCWPYRPRFCRKWTKGYRFSVLLWHCCSSHEARSKSSTDNWNCSTYCCCWLGRHPSANWGGSTDAGRLQVLLSRFDGSTDDLFDRSNIYLGILVFIWARLILYFRNNLTSKEENSAT